MLEYLYTLKNPSKEYKGHPFWSWNDKLDPEMLRWQIREMKKVGLGGYFMHARGGLETEYLSDDWFNCINACIDEGKKEGMDSWSYDENGWPSGFGGGIVTAMGDAYHVRWLECGIVGEKEINGDLLGIYAISNTDNYRFIGKDIDRAKTFMSANERLYFISHTKNPYYVDLLNPEVVKTFIDSTYEEYYSKVGENFGENGMPGFFTDEPQFANGKLPWSYIIPEEFEGENGYSPIEHLICLFKEVQGAEKFRYEFWSVVNRLYTNSFGKQIFEWCNEHNCKWTGHAMAEDNLLSQMFCTSGVMPIYEYMHNPGMDWLCRYIASPIIPKQVSSVARQLGKKHVLTESFALTGWDVSFEELKWIAEWQYVNGINWMCQHLEGYSIRGLRKRDYPPSMFYQSPWWNDYKNFNDYFTRLGKLLADGEEVVDVLVIHPMHSAWITYTGSRNKRIDDLDHDFEYVSNTLSGFHIPYHFGDETIISRYGKIIDSKFVIGACEYKYVFLPSIETLDEDTFLLLIEFIANGGKIASIGSLPIRINGKIDSRIKALTDRVDKIPKDKELMLSYLSILGIKNVSITDKNGEIEKIHYCVRDFGDAKSYFFVNLDKEKSFDAKIQIKGEKNAVKYVIETLKAYPLNIINTIDGVTIYLHFEPMQSHLILSGMDIPETVKPPKPAILLPLSKNWTIEQSDVNILTLDYCSYSVDGKDYSEYLPVLDVMDKLLSQKANCKIALKYKFTVDDAIDFNKIADMKVVIEYGSEFDITINGKTIQHDGVSWWKDKTFKAIYIKDVVINGLNEIVIKGNFSQQKKVYDVLFGKNVHETEINRLKYDTEIESIYIIGDFSVYSYSDYIEGERRALFTEGGFYINNKNVELHGGEIVTQGYPFFAGSIKLTQVVKVKKSYGENVAIKLNKPYATLAKLFVNDELVQVMQWADYYADVSKYVKPGDNKITIELLAGNRNIFGPHHHPEGELYAVSTRSFSPYGNYSLDNWRDRYCFVKIGIDD